MFKINLHVERKSNALKPAIWHIFVVVNAIYMDGYNNILHICIYIRENNMHSI